MKDIFAIGGSNSTKSINKILATYIANKLENVKVTTLDWNEFELPLYSPDLQSSDGIPENAIEFKRRIENTDAIVLSLAEYNGFHSAAFKNLWDWASRVDKKLWANKPMFLAATSPGKRGGGNVLKVTKEILPHFGGNIIADFSLPLFFENFQEGRIVNPIFNQELNKKVQQFQNSI